MDPVSGPVFSGGGTGKENLKNLGVYFIPLIPIKPNPTRIFLVGLGFLGKITTKKFLEIFPGIREPGSGSPDRPDHKKYCPTLQNKMSKESCRIFWVISKNFTVYDVNKNISQLTVIF
jgi:hypothetical protein